MIRAAAEYHSASHPEVIARADAIGLANYRAKRLQIKLDHPDVDVDDLLPDLPDLTLDFIRDHVALLGYDVARRPKPRKPRGA